MPDQSTTYANEYGLWIYFQHIASGLETRFKAFLTGFADTYACDWNDVSVYGRMDPISTFRGTRRQIDFSFDVVAENHHEAELNLANSRRLIQMLYPVYEDLAGGGREFSATSIQAPPLLRVRFANLISSGQTGAEPIDSGLVGKLGGLSYTPDLEVGFYTSDARGGQALPKVNRFSCNYTVFHTEPLGWDQDGDLRNIEHDRFPYPMTETNFDDAARFNVVAEVGSDFSLNRLATNLRQTAIDSLFNVNV